MMKKETAKGYVQLFLIIIFLGAIYALNFALQLLKVEPKINNAKNSDDYTFNAVTIKQKSQKLSFQTTAQIRARSYVPIIPEVTGRIIWVADNFKAGGCFKANQTLFKIDTDNAQAEYDQAQAQLQQAKASYELVQAESQAAIAEWKILNKGKDARHIAPLVARKPQLKQASATIKTAQARLNLAKIALKDARFSYPFSGCVESAQIEVGQFVSVVLGTASFGRVFSYNALEVQVNLPLEKIKLLHKFPHQAEIMVSGHAYTAKIDRISDIIDPQTQFAQVILKLNSVQKLQPNKIAQVKFTTQNPVKTFQLKENDLIETDYIRLVKTDNQIIQKQVSLISRTSEANVDKIFIEAFADQIKIIRGGDMRLPENVQINIIDQDQSQ